MSYEEAIAYLKEKSAVHSKGMAGDTVVVDKNKLAEISVLLEDAVFIWEGLYK